MAEKEKKEVQKVVIKPSAKKNEAKTTTKKGTATKADVKPVAAKPAAKSTTAKPVATKKVEAKPAAAKKTEAAPAKKAPAKTTPVKVEIPKAVKTATAAKAKTVYHVSKRDRDGREWKVFIQGSDKVIKLFDTQMEALEYAQSLCKNKDDGSYVVLHRLDGKIRKY